MRNLSNILLAGLLATAVGAALGLAQEAKDPERVPGSKARQLLLKGALEKVMDGTLVAELNRNRMIFGRLTPEQLKVLRDRTLAFLREDPDAQAETLQAAWDFQKLSDAQQKAYRERAAWLGKVVASLTSEQREQLKRLPPAERARRLVELRDKILATQPAAFDAASPVPTARPAEPSGSAADRPASEDRLPDPSAPAGNATGE